MQDLAGRRRRLAERMTEQGVGLLFVPPSGDLEYLTGLERRVPSFGNISYTPRPGRGRLHAPGARAGVRAAADDRRVRPARRGAGRGRGVSQRDDGPGIFASVAGGLGPVHTLAVGARTWAETVIHLLNVFGGPRLANADDLIGPLRRIKTPSELEAMERACRLVANA